MGEGNYSLNLRKANCDEGDACNFDSRAAAAAEANGTTVLPTIPEGLRTAERVCDEGFLCKSGDRQPCSAGTFSSAGASVCTPCEPGRYQPNAQARECKPCEAGRYQPKSGREDCLDCLVNDKAHFCKLGATTRLPVGDGSYSVNLRRKNCGTIDAWLCNLDSSAEAAARADGVAVETNREAGERTAERECDKGFYCLKGERLPCPADRVCPLKGMSQPQYCDAGCCEPGSVCPNGTVTAGRCSVPVKDDWSSVLNSDAPGPVRCNCPVRSFGYVKKAAQLGANQTFHRVADLEDNETATMLACAKCPDGIYCDRAGREFAHLLLFPGRWQAIEFFVSRPSELYSEGVHDCVGTQVSERCAGGPWANFSCEHGFSGSVPSVDYVVGT